MTFAVQGSSQGCQRSVSRTLSGNFGLYPRTTWKIMGWNLVTFVICSHESSL